jgi:hypothetical protein
MPDCDCCHKHVIVATQKLVCDDCLPAMTVGADDVASALSYMKILIARIEKTLGDAHGL